jgi:hypothetical protein
MTPDPRIAPIATSNSPRTNRAIYATIQPLIETFKDAETHLTLNLVKHPNLVHHTIKVAFTNPNAMMIMEITTIGSCSYFFAQTQSNSGGLILGAGIVPITETTTIFPLSDTGPGGGPHQIQRFIGHVRHIIHAIQQMNPNMPSYFI